VVRIPLGLIEKFLFCKGFRRKTGCGKADLSHFCRVGFHYNNYATSRSKAAAAAASRSWIDGEVPIRRDADAAVTEAAADHLDRHAGLCDAYGNIRDAPPLDHLRNPMVPPEEWEAVKALRDLHIQRAIIGQGLSSLDQGIRDAITRNRRLRT
jgi:hypothetical protein